MDFSWTQEQRQVRKEAAEFAQRELQRDMIRADRDGQFGRAEWAKCAAYGFQGLVLPAQYGGSARDVMTGVAAFEGLGYGCLDGGLIVALSSQVWTVQQSILHFGSEQQKNTYLTGMASGEIMGCFAITEPEAGSDVYALQTRAERTAGGYTLNGEKCYITLGPLADVALVFASTDPSVGAWGLSAFLVPTAANGVEVGGTDEKMGLRTVPFGRMRFQDCFVPEEARLGAEGAGLTISKNSLEWERSCMLASLVGTMERQLDQTVEYARKRKQGGQPIGKFQSVSNRIVEMKLRLETARLLVYKAAWLKSQGKPVAMEAALAKMHLSQCLVESSLAAVQNRGAVGYMSETGIERDLRDAVGALTWGGTVDIQKNMVARLLGL